MAADDTADYRLTGPGKSREIPRGTAPNEMGALSLTVAESVTPLEQTPNNAMAEADDLSLNSTTRTIKGVVTSAADQADWYRISASAGDPLSPAHTGSARKLPRQMYSPQSETCTF
jgi:hypothetical protein